MARPGFAFSTRFRVRYAEIDGQKVVFNSRYLEYADVAVTDFWAWTGIAEALGSLWRDAEFHVRRAEVDYLKPFGYGDEIEASVPDRAESAPPASRKSFELADAVSGDLHTRIRMVQRPMSHLPSGPAGHRSTKRIRAHLDALPGE